MSKGNKKVEGMSPEHQAERERLIMELMCLAFRAHQETPYCVFIDFSGHVDSLSISIRRSQEDCLTTVAETDFYTVPFQYNSEVEDPNSWLKHKKAVLLALLETGDVDTNMCHEVVEQVVSYEF